MLGIPDDLVKDIY